MSLRDKLPPEEVAAARQRYAITRAAELIDRRILPVAEGDPRIGDGRAIARALDAAGLLATPERDVMTAVLPLPDGGCVCTFHEQDAGGGYTEYLLEYEPACPDHSTHLWDPKQGEWVLQSEHEAKSAAKALRDAADDMDDTDDPDAIHVDNGDIDKWLRARADRIDRREAGAS